VSRKFADKGTFKKDKTLREQASRACSLLPNQQTTNPTHTL